MKNETMGTGKNKDNNNSKSHLVGELVQPWWKSEKKKAQSKTTIDPAVPVMGI